jgi:hypothetical protein
MADVEINRIQERKKDGSFVVPMDDLRTCEYLTKTFISGEYPGSGIYPIASGKVGYLRQAIITCYSGIYPVILKWADAATALSGFQVSGNASIAHLMISSGNAMGGTVIYTFEPALGPYTSGIVMVSGGSQLGGVATAVLQIDPQPYE